MKFRDFVHHSECFWTAHSWHQIDDVWRVCNTCHKAEGGPDEYPTVKSMPDRD